MLSSRWHKVIRDLWSNKTRTVLIVLAIAVGVFAFGSVFTTQEVLLTNMNTQYGAIDPSTITLRVRTSDTSLVNWALRQDEVTSAQLRSQYSIKLVREGPEVNLDLYAFPDFNDISLNRPIPLDGPWPPGRDELLLERDSVALSGAGVGDTVTVEMPDGRKHGLVFAGTVHDLNAIPASLYPQLSGYVSERTITKLGLPLVYNRLDIMTQPEYDTRAKLEVVADHLQSRLQKAGVAVYSVEVREPGEHWAKQITEGFSLILNFIGVFSLVLSGFLVVNTISALLTEQRRQIGIMKAVGGTGRQIIGIYLVLVGFYGLLALVVALPVGIGLAYLFTDAVVRFLNIDMVNFHLPVRVLVLQVAAAMAVPVIASAFPIMGGVRVSVREAVSNYGIKGGKKHGLLSRALLVVRFLPRPLLLSLRNTFRRKARLALTLGTLMLAGTLFISVVNVRASLMAFLDEILYTDFNFEAQIILDDRYERLGVENRAERVPGVTAAEGRTSLSVQYVKPDGTRSAMFGIIGLPPGTDFNRPIVLSGRWLRESDRNAIVLSSKLASEIPGVQPGSRLTLKSGDREREWEVVGIVQAAFDRVGYGTFDYVSQVQDRAGLAAALLVRTDEKDGTSQARIAAEVESSLKKSGIGVTQSMTRETIISTNASQFDFLVAFLLTMAAMTALIGALGLAGMMSLNVMERTREIGIMRSIGASNSAIAGIVLVEGLLVGGLSWLLAVPLSVPFSIMFNTLLGQVFIQQPLDFLFSPATVFIWLGIVMVVSTVASLLPAYRAEKMRIRETLAYE